MSTDSDFERVPEPEVMDDDAEARAYEEGDFRRVNASFVRRLVRSLPSVRGRVLDLGTGPGDIPLRFVEKVPGWTVTAVDLSDAMLDLGRAEAKRRGANRIEFVRADAKGLALVEPFDLVVSNSLLHHLGDPIPFWREVGRLCRPGGAIVVMDLRRPATKDQAKRLVERHAKGASPLLTQLFHQSLLAAFTPREVRGQLEAAGLAGLRVRATTDRHMVVDGVLRR